MNLQNRLQSLLKLQHYLQQNDDSLQEKTALAHLKNGWFSLQFIDAAINNISTHFLQENLLNNWIKNYDIKEDITPKKIGVVMAGNIPLVGFFDMLCVYISGNICVIKPSSKDEVLIKHFVEKLIEFDAENNSYFVFAEQLKNCDAYIATGSNNSSRYFEYYFAKYPHIIRRNRTSVAVLQGDETQAQLELLAKDVFMYYGLGCRNVSKIYVPVGYNFEALLQAFKQHDYVMDNHKYKNNFDYHLAILIMGNKFYMSSENCILTEDKNLFSPISQINYSYYENVTGVIDFLKNNDDVQCTVGNGFIEFGQTQQPSLFDYADGIDTMQFLCNL